VNVNRRRLFTGILCDLTEQKKTEQTERLAAIGQMITAVTHESRNSLQRIQAGIDMLRMDLEANADAVTELNRIERANDQLTQLYEELYSYAAPIKLDVAMRSIDEVWRMTWSNLVRLREGRQAELSEAPNGCDLRCELDEFRIEQVFRNLMENSLTACTDPVDIQIVCSDAVLARRPALLITFRDNGPGLSDETKRRIFEPFFSTKSKGTGLGMSIAQRIVEAHHGVIAVSDNLHAGAEIYITLPRQWAPIPVAP